ncbi:alpha/beta hydrolase [Paractinoplanes deccanensis]|uniref:Alpha/beta hydrolase n=1 Tax=Paractinoplanes deccanensis TaxID=113561 RepID=A0ABQ3YI42_9ACTN|nr:subtype B tannase [Actinoplanes deccanensis]GID79658.1 alpha/beta hydrolase [Actinoplanes deccanensis]
MKRRTVIMGLAAGSAATLAGTGAALAAPRGLVFDKTAYTTLTTTIDGKAVTYRFWKNIVYVANPVDAAYQSLNVSVPVTIDGKAVDATDAPILFSNSVGGYMPSSVATATGVGGAAMTGATGAGGVASGGNAMLGAGGEMVSNAKLALAAGYVVVEPGARGRTLVTSGGVYYGTAPAAIVDLKAAVRYVRANRGRIPGDVDRIVSSGTSAGGALSALLGASGDSPLYDKYLRTLGAADASDAVFAVAAYCPIADLEHADMAYEWVWGKNKLSTGALVDQTVSRKVAAGFPAYQKSWGITDTESHLLKTYLQPAATRYLASLSASARGAYLAKNTFITWKNGQATFTWANWLTHVGARKKTLPAFDAFDLSTGENNLFGTGTTKARHFTTYGGRTIAADIPAKLDLMNPMHFLREGTTSRARHWWIRVGTNDSDTSPTIVANLAAGLRRLGDDVSALMYWDAGHGANEDAADLMTWIARRK